VSYRHQGGHTEIDVIRFVHACSSRGYNGTILNAAVILVRPTLAEKVYAAGEGSGVSKPDVRSCVDGHVPMQWILVAFDKANSLCYLALLRCSFAEFSGISLFVSFF
jgi:hypothetical protein